MSKIELLKISIERAIENNDFSFLESLLDNLSLDVFIEDDEGMEYFSKYANFILDLIEVNLLFKELKGDVWDVASSLLLKKSYDLSIIIFIILKLFNYLVERKEFEPQLKILQLINNCLDVYPTNENLHLLKIYFIYEILGFQVDWDYVRKIISLLSRENILILKDILKDEYLPEDIKERLDD